MVRATAQSLQKALLADKISSANNALSAVCLDELLETCFYSVSDVMIGLWTRQAEPLALTLNSPRDTHV
jgi:hypothetical protein